MIRSSEDYKRTHTLDVCIVFLYLVVFIFSRSQLFEYTSEPLPHALGGYTHLITRAEKNEISGDVKHLTATPGAIPTDKTRLESHFYCGRKKFEYICQLMKAEKEKKDLPFLGISPENGKLFIARERERSWPSNKQISMSSHI